MRSQKCNDILMSNPAGLHGFTTHIYPAMQGLNKLTINNGGMHLVSACKALKQRNTDWNVTAAAANSVRSKGSSLVEEQLL